MKINVLNVQRAIHEDVDEASYSTHYNMLICMITSFMLFLGAIASFIVRYFLLHTELSTVIMDSAVLAALGVGFEIFLRTPLKSMPSAIHIISLLYAAAFAFVSIRFYYLIGPSIWVLGLVQVLFAMAHNSSLMLRYVLSTISLSVIYILVFAPNPHNELIYYIMLIVFFALTAIVASIVYRVINIRNRKIMSQFKKIMRETEEKKKAQRENIKLSFYDRLTGLPNRALCIERLSQALHFAKGGEGKVYVFLIDIDMLKMINDTMGHNAGDVLVKSAAQRLSAIFDYGFVARTGGDKFVIILQSDKKELDIKSAADRILRTMKEPFIIDPHKFSVTCSVGISRFPSDGSNAETLIKNAELAIYKAKEEGKNCFQAYSEDLKHNAQTEMDLIRDMQNALVNDEFELYYQPQINSVDKTIIGFEALLRWKHPVRGMIPPSEFIPAAEKSGLIVPIGQWVIKSACAQNKAWQDEGFATVPMAVNISSQQIYCDSFVEQLSSILKETRLDPSYLELEITERVLVKELAKAKEILHNIKSLGVTLAIDDFGTGYSSIYYLKELPIDFIKLPMEFVHGIGINIKDESIISVILGLADNLNMHVIAEGVETEVQLDFLTKNLCTSIQGYYYCKPMEAKTLVLYCDSNFKKAVMNDLYYKVDASMRTISA